MKEELENIDIKTIQSLSSKVAWHYQIVPRRINGELAEYFISKNNLNTDTEDALHLLTGKNISFVAIEENELVNALTKYYPQTEKLKAKKAGKSEGFLTDLIEEARDLGSSDIHLEAYEKDCRARIRMDGKLVEKYIIAREEYLALINKIKIQANLDISEKRLPQDGRINFGKGKQAIDIRVSILPTLHGEKAVLRLLSKEASLLDLKRIGMSAEQLSIYKRAVTKAHGIVLISGPTGSGKTTTLYATLNELNNKQSNILTIEDPIEYTLDGINQVQLKEKIDLSFASALRTFLRQDPDIIMLGEIRDPETAQMATRAALTGHLVLSTIHTNSAYGIISRLMDMGVPGYLLAGTLNIAVAQRLLRLLCPECKTEQKLEPEMLPAGFNGDDIPEKHFVATGCNHCFFTGYKGRTAIYEMIEIDEELAEIIRKDSLSLQTIREKAEVTFLTDSAKELFFSGKTSLEEVYPILITNQL